MGGREIGYLFGQYKRIRNEFTGVLTGKSLNWGGSLIRPEATGYGCVYFAQNMLATRNDDLQGKVCLVSGSGNVAQYTVEKLNELGAKAVTMSDSNGYIYDPDGISPEKLAWVMELKNKRRGRIAEYVKQFPKAQYFEGQRPWSVPCDCAFPSATQNEINGEDARTLIKNGCTLVAEGANMPTDLEGIETYLAAKILYGPAKAANAGGVATSGLEMSQNSQRLSWTREEVDHKLKTIMANIHANAVAHAREYSSDKSFTNYVTGANIAGFVKDFKSLPALGTATLRTFSRLQGLLVCYITVVSGYAPSELDWAVKNEPDDLSPEFEGPFSSPSSCSCIKNRKNASLAPIFKRHCYSFNRRQTA